MANLGNKLSLEQRKAQSERMKGVVWSDERNRKLSESKKGVKRKPFSEETRRNMSLAHKGKKQSQEIINKRVESLKKNYKPLSEETKLIKRNQLIERWKNDEYRERMSKSLKERFATKEYKIKKKEAVIKSKATKGVGYTTSLKGSKQSPEHIRKRMESIANKKEKNGLGN